MLVDVICFKMVIFTKLTTLGRLHIKDAQN